MHITSDWHIHTRNSYDSACMTVADLLQDAAARGVTDFGITDHLNTPYNLPDIAASRREYLACDPSPRFHFGVEISCMSQWEIDEVATGNYPHPVHGIREGGPAWSPPAICLTADIIEQFGIEYVVAGVHWPLYVPVEREAIIRDYHRQNMFLVTHPLVDIVAHPWWWWSTYWQDAEGHFSAEPWFDDFHVIPQSMHDEFAAAAVAHGTAVEINLNAYLLCTQYPDHIKRQYLEYLAGLKARGVTLSIGSDCHAARYDYDIATCEVMLDSVGITENDLWRLPARG